MFNPALSNRYYQRRFSPATQMKSITNAKAVRKKKVHVGSLSSTRKKKKEHKLIFLLKMLTLNSKLQIIKTPFVQTAFF